MLKLFVSLLYIPHWDHVQETNVNIQLFVVERFWDQKH